MRTTEADEAAIRQVFAWLFSSRWITSWTARWHRAQPEEPRVRERCFTLRVSLWCMIWQRLRQGASLDAVLALVLAGNVDGLGPRRGGKLSKRLKSSQTSAYNQARQRLPLRLVKDALSRCRNQLLRWVGQADRQPPRVWLDGSTLRVLANTALVRRFSPARVRRGQTDWCLMRVCVGFCCRCGAALYATLASQHVSEQAMAWDLMLQAVRGTLWIGDRNFGVWSVVAQAVRCRQHVVVRLTRARARALLGRGKARRAADQRVQWIPSGHTQRPPSVAEQAVEGRLIQVRLRRGPHQVRLWLFTTLLDPDLYPVERLVRWYGERWGAELNFRTLKTHLAMAELVVGTPEMVEREFYVGILAYNLVRTLMWKELRSAEEAEPRARLSFTKARSRIVEWMELWSLREPVNRRTAPRWLRRIRREISRCLLPRRRQPRPAAARMVRHRPPSKFPSFSGSRATAQRKHARCEAVLSRRIDKPLSEDA